MLSAFTRFVRLAAPFVLGFLLTAFILTGWTGDAQTNVILSLGTVAYRDGSLALCWWAGAWGLGLGLTRLAIGPSLRAIRSAAVGRTPVHHADETSLDELAIALGLGSAFLLTLDAVLGSVGLLGSANGLVAWGVIGVGVILGARVLREAPVQVGGAASTSSVKAPGEVPAPSSAITAVYGLAFGAITALLITAASSAPGWLWSSEFGGFDALSYHLVLPKEWFLAGGTITPIDGNVYSALPSFVESAFLHLMFLRSNPIDGAYACQWWAAGATLATAFALTRLARALISPHAGTMAALVFLATPWTTVVGSLAYNDMAPCLLLATGWLLLVRASGADQRLDLRAALSLALLAAAAFGGKPSALLFMAFPLLTLTLLRAGPRALRFAPMVLLLAVVVLSPWLVRNQLAYGNPCFPFLSKWFGSDSWSSEQMAVFQQAHGAPGTILERLPLFIDQWIGYGLIDPRTPREPWFPLWSVLPVVGLGALVWFASTSMKRAAPSGRFQHWSLHALLVIVVMGAGWVLATHLKSRFLLPSVVPLSLGVAALFVQVRAHFGERTVAGVLIVALLVPFVAYMREPVRAGKELRAPSLFIDGADQRTGFLAAAALAEVPPDQRAALLQTADCSYFINFALPQDAKLVGIGFATPFYILRPLKWSTVWDRGAFDAVVDAAPGTPAAWGARLHALGFTHAVIDPTMLEVWSRSGWLNPSITSGQWLQPFVDANTLFARTVDGKIILTLEPAP